MSIKRKYKHQAVWIKNLALYFLQIETIRAPTIEKNERTKHKAKTAYNTEVIDSAIFPISLELLKKSSEDLSKFFWVESQLSIPFFIEV